MKTLTREEAKNAGARAYQVVNGFNTVRGVQASDALNLAHTCEQLYDALESARTKLSYIKAKAENHKDGSYSGSYEEMFGELFGRFNNLKSKK